VEGYRRPCTFCGAWSASVGLYIFGRGPALLQSVPEYAGLLVSPPTTGSICGAHIKQDKPRRDCEEGAIKNSLRTEAGESRAGRESNEAGSRRGRSPGRVYDVKNFVTLWFCWR
jgi:hypothetical protein